MKIPDEKIPATDSSIRKGKAQKEYAPEDPESYPYLSDSSLSESFLSNNSNYKIKIFNKKRKYRKHKKQETVEFCTKSTAKLPRTAYNLKVLKLK